MVSLDKAEKNAEFAESLDGNFPLLSDPGSKVAKTYGVAGFAGLYAKRWTFYIDVDGIVRHIDKDVSTETAGQDMAARLKALGFPLREEPTAVEPAPHAPAVAAPTD